jgi:hypothetical protein
MRLTSTATKLFSLLLLLAACTTFSSQAIGTTVRGGSNYGTGSFASCTTVPLPPECGEGFNLTPVGTFTLGGNTHSIVQFAFDPSFDPTPTGVNVLDVVDLGMIGPNATFTLPSAFFTPSLTEIFSCNNVFTPTSGGGTVILDSGGHVVNGPCTPVGVTSVPDLILNLDGSFTTGADFNLNDLVLDSPVPIATPEPSSLVLLLGTGLLAVGRKVRRAC